MAKQARTEVQLRKTFIRSYTLRIIPQGDIEEKSNQLWNVHAGICRGAAIFGNLLLDIAGALPAALANNFKNSVNADLNRRTLRGRRIALVLNWFSVENAESPFSVLDRISTAGNEGMLLPEAKKHLNLILKQKNVDLSEYEDWHNDVLESLTSRIRVDAVWVNRAKRANDRPVAIDGGEATKIIEKLFKNKSFKIDLPDPSNSANQSEDNEEEETKTDSRADPSQASRDIFSDLFGDRDSTKKKELAQKKSNIAGDLLKLFDADEESDADEETLCKKILQYRKNLGHSPQTIDDERSPPEVKKDRVAGAYTSLLIQLGLRKVGNKPNDPPTIAKRIKDLRDACKKLIEAKNQDRPLNPVWAKGVNLEVATAAGIDLNDKQLTEFLRLTLAFAARRFAQVRSWMRLMEIDREKSRIKKMIADKSLDHLDPEKKARNWLIKYEQKRTDRLHIERGEGSIVITKRMCGDQAAIFEKFNGLESDSERESAINSLQEELKKFDADLYKSIAKDGLSLGVNAATLEAWVSRNTAMEDTQRLRIPRYSHPDPFSHPTFVEFGAEDSSKPRIHYALHNGSAPNQCGSTKAIQPQEVYLQLPTTEGSAEWVSFLWKSKRFWRDVGASSLRESDIPRADRFGTKSSVDVSRPRAMFSGCKGWNGRLQVARDELEALKKYWNSDAKIWIDKGEAMRKLRWLLTISSELEQADGPKKQIERQTNKSIYKVIGDRGWHAHAPFARVPGLRVLGVDLGHRTAAACTVWRTITLKELKKICDEAGVSSPNKAAMFHHISRKKGHGRKIFRRIGDDELPDGTVHPAPWAELERQFFIRLDGERDPEPLTKEEIIIALNILEKTGCTSDLESKTMNGQSLTSMKHPDVCSGLLWRSRAFLRRHADIARIIAAISNVSASTADQENAFLKWLTYSSDRDGQHTAIGCAWLEFVGVPIPDGLNKEDIARNVAATFWVSSQRNNAINHFTKLWSDQERDLLGKDGVLRQLRGLVMPKQREQRKRVGGLGVTRLANIGQLRGVQKAFATRLLPDGKHEVIKKGFSDRALRQLEQLRMQRVKQLSSRLIEAALGKGKETSRKKGLWHKRSWVTNFPQCHAIVLEHLKNYRPDYTQSRRENRRLLEWSSSKVEKFIMEGCELHGVAKTTVLAAYTSQYDFRTGRAGRRGMSMLPSTIRQAFWLQKMFGIASRKKDRNKALAVDDYLLKIQQDSLAVNKSNDLIYFPIDGGQLFLPSFSADGTLGPIDADLNASANIGLRAITDTDWRGAWWRILVESRTGFPVADKITGCKAIDSTISLQTPKDPEQNTSSDVKSAKHRAKKTRKEKQTDDEKKTYVWRDPSCDVIRNPWLSKESYWIEVEKGVIEALSLDNKTSKSKN